MSRIRPAVAGLSSVTQPSPLPRNFESVTHFWLPAEATAPPGSLSANGGLERVLTSGPVAATSMTESCGREPAADLAPTLNDQPGRGAGDRKRDVRQGYDPDQGSRGSPPRAT